jgi:hypothetical protein
MNKDIDDLILRIESGDGMVQARHYGKVLRYLFDEIKKLEEKNE